MTAWRYEIQHGPDNEADWAWVYDDKNAMMCVARTHHAATIVAQFANQPTLAGTATPKPEGEALVSVINGSPIASFVRSYQFDAADEGIVHTPTHAEQCMIEDAICSFISEPGLLEAALSTAPAGDGVAGMVLVSSQKLIALRDALTAGDVSEAYHVLYSIACPDFDKYEPWDSLERLSASTAGGGK